MRHCRTLPAVLLAAASLTASLAVPLAAAAQAPMKVASLKLKNGLTVFALEDHTVPSAAFYTYSRVGSRNEAPGITGLSHLFEHMMFNGSAKFGPKMFDQVLEAGGGYSNAFTTADTTEYQDEFSSKTLDILLRMEADRIRSLRIDKRNLEQERGIVKEERRMRIDNSVEGAMSELLWNTAFTAHPYRWETAGVLKDLDAIQVEDARRYFKTYYAPNNAIVAVVGDFDTKTLFAKMKQYFEDIPAQPAPRPVPNSEPEQRGEKRVSYHFPAELPAVTLGYKGISFKHADEAALNLLSIILSSGESSRLYRALVYEKQVATAVSSGNDSRLQPGLFTFYGQARPGRTAEEVEKGIYEVLERVKAEGVTERELQKAKNMVRAGFVGQFTTNVGRAGLIAGYQGNWGDWRKVYEHLPKHDKVTVADIQRVAKRYFDERKRTVVTLVPEKGAAE
jgi:predicted Zn-dependent peptidase